MSVETDGERFELSSRVNPDYPLSRRALSATQATVLVGSLGDRRMMQRACFRLESFRDVSSLGLQPSFDAKPHSHWPVLQRPTSASGKAV